jgi:steroid delta-isomerase
MPDPAKMEAAVHEYVAAFAAHSADRVVALYADNAVVEDPIGTPRHEGLAAIRAFYEGSIATGATLELTGPVRVVQDIAAFAFSVHLEWQGAKQRIDVIDTFRFNDDNKVVEMRAYWGPTNMHALG